MPTKPRAPGRRNPAHSVNTAFAGLVAKLGPCKVRDLMTKMGLHKGDGTPITAGPSATTLGSDSVSPLTLAAAYATVASGGTYCHPTPVVSITTARMFNLRLGKTFYWGEVFGATIAAPIWKRIMDRASAGMPVRDFAEPGGTVQSGDFASIPRVYGLSLSNAMGLLPPGSDDLGHAFPRVLLMSAAGAPPMGPVR